MNNNREHCNKIKKKKKKYYFPFKNPINIENWQMFHFPFLRHQKYIEDPLYFTLYINFIHTFNAYFTLYKINFGYIVLQIIKNICLFEILLYRNFLIFQYTTLNTKNKNIRHTTHPITISKIYPAKSWIKSSISLNPNDAQ